MRRNLLLATGALLAVILPLLMPNIAEESLKTSAQAKEQTHFVWSASVKTSGVQQKIVKKPIQRTRPRLLAQAAPVQKAPQILHPAINQLDITPTHQLIANEVLQLFPKQCQSSLKNFYVRYEKPKQRGLASKSSIVLDGTVPDDEFRALFIHELGHVMDLGCLVGTAASGDSMFDDHGEIMYNDDPSVAFYSISWKNDADKKQTAKKEDFASGYAVSDPFEDLAETTAYYVLHKEMFQQRAKTNEAMKLKLQWMETYLFPKPLTVAQSKETWTGKVTWDITILKYVWNGLAL